MNARVLVRATSLVAVAITGWSLNVQWGSDPAVRGGPPMQWESSVVGAAILSGLAALAVWLGTRPAAAASRPWLRGAACLCAVGAAAVALQLRREAGRLHITGLVNGPGWAWLATGAGLAVAAAAGSLAVRDAIAARRSPRRRPRG